MQLPFDDASFCDIAVVQGGLHHLNELPGDLNRTLLEVKRVLRPSGRVVIVEPLVDAVSVSGSFSLSPPRGSCWAKLNALATMIEFERHTYEQWLRQPRLIRQSLDRHFKPEIVRVCYGKLMYVGRNG